MTSKRHQRNWSKQPSLEEAVAECVRFAERDPGADREELLSRFPRWQGELREFLDNWSEMERLSSGLSGQRRTLQQFARPGTTVRYFGDYELLEELGFGGMGVIFKARQISLDRIVAIKMILDPRHDRERFRVEAEAAASLNHPNIVSIYEVGEFEGHPYFSMRFIDGGSLSDRIDAGPLPPKDAAELTATISRAVHFAHQRGILHRDLKPANVLLDAGGDPYVSDFGLAKQVQDDTELTQTGAILGTPGYMAPEQAIGEVKNLTVAVDIHGLGAVLYAALVADPPHRGETTLETLRQVAEATPRPPREKRAEIPRDLEIICLKCLEKSAEARYPSAAALADDLERFLRHEPIEARPVGHVERFARWCRRNPAVASLTTAITVLLIATTVVSAFLARSEHRAKLAAKAGEYREYQLRQREQLARQDTIATLADSYTSRGIMADYENPHEALPWFAGAAELARGDPDRVRANLIRLHSWKERVLEPIAVLWLNGARVTAVQFHNDRTHLLCTAGMNSVLWNYRTGEQWTLSELVGDIMCATLCANGKMLAVGSRNGHVVVANIEMRQVVRELTFHDQVEQVEFTQDGKILAVAANKSVHLWDFQKSAPIGAALEHPGKVLRVKLNSSGDRLVTVSAAAKRQRGHTHVFRIGDSEPLFSIPCVVDRDSNWITRFWPTLIKRERQLLVKSGRRAELPLSDDGTSDFAAFDLDTGQLIREYPMGATHALVVSPDTETVVDCANRYARIKILQPSGVTPHRERLVHRERVVAADFNSDGTLVATGGWDRYVRLWSVGQKSPPDVSPHDPRPTLAVLSHQDRVTQIKFSLDSRLLATVQVDGLVRVSRLPKFEHPVVHMGGATHAKLIPSLARSALDKTIASTQKSQPDGWLFAVTGNSNRHARSEKMSIHGVDNGEQVGPTVAADGVLMDSDLSPTGRQLATAHAAPGRRGMFRGDGSAGSLRLWTWPDASREFESIPLPAEPRSLAYRPDGKQLAVICARGQVLLIDTHNGTVTKSLSTTGRKLFIKYGPRGHGRVRYTPDGRTLIAWSRGVWVFDVATEQIRYPAIDNVNEKVSIDISNDGRLLAVTRSESLTARVFDLQSGRLLGQPIKHPAKVFSLRFSPDGQRLLTACRDGQARVFHWGTGDLVLRGLSHERDVLNATYTPDGEFILTVGRDGRFRTWRAADGRLAIRPHRVGAFPQQILVTPDSRFAIVTGLTGEIHVVRLDALYKAPIINVAQARLVGELLSNQLIHDGGTVKLTTPEWLDRWQQYSSADALSPQQPQDLPVR